ncbi:MAG: putative acyltransferase YihG [Alphaproteobacteria bacterium ADurb.BinA280]|jgi:1-acyl-sn-glycerol-3-phosphate acyltransferase|nr:acyltransferase [Xanthomonadales bacterium]MCC6505592.1 acyltransferase [Aquimonas sp.]OPZ11947.1 MAG: putative acyltransferase YihG [Alphaproteobacteria bacterium ADurb.BinA280]
MTSLQLARTALNACVILLSTLIHVPLLLLFAAFKLVAPGVAAKRFFTRILMRLAESWIAVNSWLINHLTPTRIDIDPLPKLQSHGWYLVISNHQSWVDIPVLQMVFNKRVPMLKFFLKQQLIWVPLLGLAWWALDFPFMRRHTHAVLKKHPHLKGKDVEATRKACAKFRYTPVSVMNFVEGTRFTPEKHARRASPYQHLLPPKAGGVGFVLQTMGELMHEMLDVSIVYPSGRPTMLDLIAGRIPTVRVHVVSKPIPAELCGQDYENDPAFRVRFQAWLNALWHEKDITVQRMHVENSQA